MKRLLAVVLVCSLVLSMSTISVKADDNVEQKAMQIYQEMLEESGLITSNQSIVLKDSQEAQYGINTYVADSEEQAFSNIVAYIEEDGILEDAYSVIYRSVATGKTAELSNSSIMGFTLTVYYDYYYPQDNGYTDPYYRHGALEVQASMNPMISSVGDFNCVYLSRGVETNSEGNWSGDFVSCESRVIADTLHKKDYYYVRSGDCGNPYLWKFGSTVENGCAFSGIAYSFSFGGRTYSDTMVILYDTTQDFFDFTDFDWGI